MPSNKQKWTEEEDKLLVKLYGIHGESWMKIAPHFPHRSYASVQGRWRTVDPTIVTGAWSPEEDFALYEWIFNKAKLSAAEYQNDQFPRRKYDIAKRIEVLQKNIQKHIWRNIKYSSSRNNNSTKKL